MPIGSLKRGVSGINQATRRISPAERFVYGRAEIDTGLISDAPIVRSIAQPGGMSPGYDETLLRLNRKDERSAHPILLLPLLSRSDQ